MAIIQFPCYSTLLSYLAWPGPYCTLMPLGMWHIFPQELSEGPWWVAGFFTELVGIVRLSQRGRGPASLWASEPRENISTEGGWVWQDTDSLPIYRHSVSPYPVLIADGCQWSQGRTTCISSQPSDSSQACQLSFKQAYACCGEGNANERCGNANEEEQQLLRQGRKTEQLTTHGLVDKNSLRYVKGCFRQWIQVKCVINAK